MDEGKLGEQMARASRAAQLLNEDAFNEAFDAVATQLKARWVNSEPAQSEERERIWNQLYQLGQVRMQLLMAVANGKQAVRDLEQLAANHERSL